MENKVLVKIVIPKYDESYDVYLPINKKIGNIVLLINKAVYDISNGIYKLSDKAELYNRLTNKKYAPDELLYDTDIRNGSILILI